MITHIKCIEKMQLIQITGLVPVAILNTHQYSPEVEGTIPYQITNQTRLSPCSARDALVSPVHVDSPHDREEKHDSIVPELPRNIHG
jgi:hypothetical protein